METNCTDTEIQRVLNRSLILTPYPYNKSNNDVDVDEVNNVKVICYSSIIVLCLQSNDTCFQILLLGINAQVD